ncbi:DNA repair protein RecN [Legionella impletisoli]|uniref:DNA repair protein RecN n=1 Tax=Legionella impletisoli TaxID=343510 RepID=A0A917JVL6_9GAMM|nr:DNA repair protein RecN [Legionella impletisoli]GGI84583.1 DNA repair protein RecN [Legionella impletisoli]
MLTSLRIENFAIVAKLELDFESGMTAFTGETGAGKSIMIDALMLALGDRADVSVIRPGADKCDITACFHYDEHSLPAQWLKEHEVSSDEGVIYLRRVIHGEGRSKSYINGQPFPLQKVKELSERLVDIHGQHQHQSLLHHATHRQQLDQFANHDSLLERVAALFQTAQTIKKEIERLERQHVSEERQELLRFQIEELRHLNSHDGEMQQLHEEHQCLHHAREYLEHAQEINTLLNSDDEPNIIQGLNHIMQRLSSLPAHLEPIKNALELINSALIQCEEANDEITRFSEQISLDPERLNELEARISQLHQAARKYHVDANQLTNVLIELEKELNTLDNSGQKLIELKKDYQSAIEDYQKAAETLRQSRHSYAKKLAGEISGTIQLLGMPHGYIEIEITPLEKMQLHGQDKVEYKVCTNPGMKPDTLNKVASGGELSRISLAIQMITAQRGSTPTLLFDEVDVGIGGATAALVGRLLRTLGERLQVFCVTHQPQVAASAHHHFLVEKHSDQQQTYSHIIRLQDSDKINEIARMLGGLKVTEQTRSHAKELLQQFDTCLA